MSDKETAQSVIDAYRKRQQAARKAPVIIGVSAVLLIAGAALLIFWLLGSDSPSFQLSFLASDTPTPTETATATATATASFTPTITATETITPTATITPTQAGPFIYQVQEGDNLWAIAEQFGVDLLVLITVNNLDPANPTIRVGDKLTIPASDAKLPSATPLPSNIARGTIIDYQVQLGDSMLSIAIAYNSTVDAIKEENEIENENEIFVGQILKIPVNLVTPLPPSTATPTVNPALLGTQTITTTQTVTATP
jgi:LysM repeat protein